ncbi:MAG: FAD-dependent oxidoreductase, partial [Planctomycetota bacterium]
QSAIFRADVPPGEYEVRMAYSAHTNRARNVAVRIRHAKGEATVLVDQRQWSTPDSAPWQSLGTYEFAGPSEVVLDAQHASGYVIADAVQWLPIAKD